MISHVYCFCCQLFTGAILELEEGSVSSKYMPTSVVAFRPVLRNHATPISSNHLQQNCHQWVQTWVFCLKLLLTMKMLLTDRPFSAGYYYYNGQKYVEIKGFKYLVCRRIMKSRFDIYYHWNAYYTVGCCYDVVQWYFTQHCNECLQPRHCLNQSLYSQKPTHASH